MKLFLYIKNVKSPISHNLSLEPLVFNFFYQKTCSEKYFSVKADASGVNLTAESITIKNTFKDQLEQSLNQSSQEELHNIRDKILSFGPKNIGSNILVKSSQCSSLGDKYLSSLIHGFQLATQAGPLCEEPLSGHSLYIRAVSS